MSVHRYAVRKRAALAAHQSFVRDRAGRAQYLPAVMVALPVPLFGFLFGREWFTEAGAAPPPSAQSLVTT